MSPWVWVVVIVVVLAVIGLVVSRSRTKRLEDRREEAASLRDTAEEHRAAVQQHEVAASTSEADARRAREEAEATAAHARELEAQAARDREKRDEALATHEEHLRRADAVDPDVTTDDEGYRLDDEGRRVEEPAGTLDVRPGPDHAEGRVGDETTGGEAGYASSPAGMSDDRGDVTRADGGYTGTHRAEESPLRDARTGEVLDDQGYSTESDHDALDDGTPDEPRREDDGVDERVGERPSWQERARERADDVIGRRDTDGDGHRG